MDAIASLGMLVEVGGPLTRDPSARRFCTMPLPDRLRQPTFLRTGGPHATGLVTPRRRYRCVPMGGSKSPPVFPRVLDRLVELIPRVSRETIDGAAHLSQLTTRGAHQHAAV